MKVMCNLTLSCPHSMECDHAKEHTKHKNCEGDCKSHPCLGAKCEEVE